MLIILTLFISCSHKEKNMISVVEVYYANRDITTIVAARCSNFMELLDTKKVVIKDSNLLKKLSKISFENDANGNLEGDIRVKAFFHYLNNTVDTLCISYTPAVMYLNSKSVKYNIELEKLLSSYIYK